MAQEDDCVEMDIEIESNNNLDWTTCYLEEYASLMIKTSSEEPTENKIILQKGTFWNYDVDCSPTRFFTLINGEEIYQQEEYFDSYRILSIPLEKGENEIEIIIATIPGLTANEYCLIETDGLELKPIQENYQTGIIQWNSRCYSTHDVANITVIDRDMNVDSNIPEQFQIDVWSDWLEEETEESRIIPVNVIETGNSTGVFEGLVFLGSAYDESTGHRVPVGIENVIFAKYVDYTGSDSNELEIIETTSAKILSIGDTWERWAELSSLYDIPLVYDPCLKKQMDAVGTGDDFAQLDVIYSAPLKQIESGLHIDEVICKDNLVLIKKNNGYRYCVNPDTVYSLHERGWATNANLNGASSRQCYSVPDAGLCKAAIEKYYFDSESDSCKSFTWGGCGGNIPFDTLELCQGFCK